jgi:hypothetical protein
MKLTDARGQTYFGTFSDKAVESMSARSKTRAPKREQVALLLAARRSTAKAAAAAGASRRAVPRWLAKSPDFAARVSELRAVHVRHSGGLPARCTTHAGRRLSPLLERKDDRVALDNPQAIGIRTAPNGGQFALNHGQSALIRGRSTLNGARSGMQNRQVHPKFTTPA